MCLYTGRKQQYLINNECNYKEAENKAISADTAFFLGDEDTAFFLGET